MERQLSIGLFNDSFPPTIDGVANTVLNYATSIQAHLGRAVVATPWYPDVEDNYAFEVVRYPSLYINERLGYRAGLPYDPSSVRRMVRADLDILHVHAPFMSGLLARMVRHYSGAPIVFTYHTKFDIDIKKRVQSETIRQLATRFALANINACDEVWVVSEGAGENLRELGYMGSYRVMENGTDFAKGRADEAAVEQLRAEYHLPEDLPVFLYVGRMMWYKGVRLSLDGLREAKAQGARFKMVLVGDGADRAEMETYVQEQGLGEDCVFTGAIRDREVLRAFYTLADLFLFPSTYDTNGIVVREAAACSCPSLLIRGSCAAEGIQNGVTGVVINECVSEMARAILMACEERSRLQMIGQQAADRIYLSWDDAVARAYDRYQEIVASAERKEDDLPLFLSHMVREWQYCRSTFQSSRRLTQYRLLRTERKMVHTLRNTEEHFTRLLERIQGDDDVF